MRAITLKSSKTEAGLSLTSITLITAAAVAIIKLFYANASRYRGTDEFFYLPEVSDADHVNTRSSIHPRRSYLTVKNKRYDD